LAHEPNAPAQPIAPRIDIPSLTGLRGVAAWLVVIAHTDSYFVAAQPPALEYAWRVGANLGMTTFFVLSGFVIHYNYGAAIVARGAPAIRSFLLARFARLYPLYLLALVIGMAVWPWILHEDAFYRWVPRYLTMTQDWTPALIDGKLAATLYLGNAWSISAEVALYVFYLALAAALDGLRTRRAVVGAIAVLTAAGLAVAAGYAGGFWFDDLPLQNWWLSLSPLARLPEFLLGALTAQAYLVGVDRHARWLGAAGALWVAAAFAASYRFPAFQNFFGFAPGVAALIFFFARARSRASVLIENRAMIALGDASYSVYMLHGFAIYYVMKQTPYVPGLLRIALAWALIAVLSALVYRWFESPARRLIRSMPWRGPRRLRA
jgi:peptidoglycan/LPS O-acetylase OafA/YrhL